MTYLHLKSFCLTNHRSQKQLYQIINKLHDLEKLLTEESAENTYKDPRLNTATWKAIVVRELHYFKKWLHFRCRLDASHRVSDSTLMIDQALVLLPRNAISMHILRRVMPFLALGIHTDVGFHPTISMDEKKVLFAMACVLNVHRHLCYQEDSAVQKLKNFSAAENNLVCCTGKNETLLLLREYYTGHLVGCAGNCAILVCDNFDNANKISQSLAQQNYSHSCTSLKYKCVLVGDDSLWVSEVNAHDYKLHSANQFIADTHPSIILTHGVVRSDQYNRLLNYSVVDCDSNGYINNQIGFARDPKFGWPGDYLL